MDHRPSAEDIRSMSRKSLVELIDGMTRKAIKEGRYTDRRFQERLQALYEAAYGNGPIVGRELRRV